MKVIFSGGGTIGSVSPLLAIAEGIKQQEPNVELLWLSTKNGPEKKLIAGYGITTKEISSEEHAPQYIQPTGLHCL